MTQLSPFLTGLLGQYTPPLPQNAVGMLAAYTQRPPIRATFGRLATSVGAAPWLLSAYSPSRSPDGPFARHMAMQRAPSLIARELFVQNLGSQLVPQVDHKFFYRLIEGTGMFAGGLLMRLTNLHVDLAGCAFWYLERDPSTRKPSAAWPIPPYWVTRRPTIDDAFPFYRLQWRGASVDVPQTEILAFLDPDPLLPYDNGAGPGMSLGDEVNTGVGLAQMLSAYFKHPLPPMLLMPKNPMMGTDIDEKMKAWEKRWAQRAENEAQRGIPYIFSAEMMVKELTAKFQENQIVELLRVNWDVCRMVAGEPPEIVGDVRNANPSVVDAAFDLFARLNVEPRLDYFCRVLQSHLVEREYDPRLILSYESPVQKNSEYFLRTLGYALEAVSIDEIRKALGKGPDPSGLGHLRIVRKGTSFAPLVETPPDQIAARNALPDTEAHTPPPKHATALADIIDDARRGSMPTDLVVGHNGNGALWEAA